MSYWEWIIRVDGTQISQVINAVEVNVGTQNPLDQPLPATASISILGAPEQGLDWYLGKSVEIMAYVTGTFNGGRIFYGRVTQQTSTPIDGAVSEVITELTAESYMPLLADIALQPDVLPAATEFERVYSFLERQYSPSWADLPSSMTWSDIPTFFEEDIDWSEWIYNYEFYRPPLKVLNWVPSDPDPSLELETYTTGPTDMLTHVIEMASGAGGWVEEYFGGLGPEIYYYTRADVTTGSYPVVDISGAAYSLELVDTSGIWDVYTDVTVSNSTLSASDANFDAVKQFGKRELQLTSMAALEADLQTLATVKVGALSRAVPNLTRVTVEYNELPVAKRIWNLNVTKRRLTGIPAVFGGDDDYLIRGMTFRGSRERLTVDWTLLNRRVVEPGPMWRNVSAALTWADLVGAWSEWE